MSSHNEKLLELKEIKCIDKEYFLKLRLSFIRDIDLLWKIDTFTAKNLKTIVDFDNKHNYKYRLSFFIPFDPNDNHTICLLTRTFREKSEQFYYLCSYDYMNNLKKIKNCKDINELDEINDLTTKEIKSNNNILLKHQKFKIAFVFLTVLAIMLFTPINYLGKLYPSKSAFNENATAVYIDKNTTPLSNKVYSKENALGTLDDFTIHQPSIAFFELENQINYGLPKGKVALTFDDGPSIYSQKIVDILNEYQVGATFFFVGQNIKKHPEHIDYIHSKGYSIGSHSMNHIDMTRATYEEQKKEILQSIELIEKKIGEKVVLFRPPYGFFNEQIEELIYSNQLKVVLWSNDPEDWKVHDGDKIIKHIKNTDVSGSIILLHENKHVVKALPKIIEFLQAMDLEIVNLK